MTISVGNGPASPGCLPVLGPTSPLVITFAIKYGTLVNPPMDASSVKYKLISIVEQRPVAFPQLAIKGLVQTQANGYEANIFDPVHFYLEGDEFGVSLH